MVAIRIEQVAFKYCALCLAVYTTRMESINTTGTNMKERKEVLRGEKDVEICNFLLSLRGRILLGQALTIAVKELEKVPSDIRQHSNIWDMKYILDSDIPISLED